MDGRMHRKTAEWAAKRAAGEVWRQYIGKLSDASTYPDAYVFGRSAPDKTGWDKDWEKLVLIPNEGQEVVMHRLYDTQNLRATYLPVVRCLVHLALTALREGNGELAAKAAGTLTHLAGDTYQPAHATDNRMVLLMYPQGEYRYMVHAFMEAVLCDVAEEDYQPRILADSEEGLVWRIVEEMEKGRLQSISEIPILMGALRSGDEQTAQASAIRTATNCAKMNADMLASIDALYQAKCQAVPAIRLTDLPYMAVDSDNLYNFGVMIDALPGATWYTPNAFDIGEGATWGVSVQPMLAQSYMDVRKAYVTYNIADCGYTHFCCKLGLQHFRDPQNMPNHGRGNETACVFEVRLDGETVYRSAPIVEADAPVQVEVPLGVGHRELTLYVRDVREPNALTRFVYPIFAEPTLMRK